MEKYHIPKKYKKTKIKEQQSTIDSMYKKVDNDIKKSIGVALEDLYNYKSDEYITGIYRTNNTMEDIFQKGICYFNDDNPTYDDHVQKMDNFVFMLAQIKYCMYYKGATGVFIAKIPIKDVKKGYGEPDPIYYKAKDGKTYLKPEYIAAYVRVSLGNVESIRFNEYSHDRLYNIDTEYYYDEHAINIRLGR